MNVQTATLEELQNEILFNDDLYKEIEEKRFLNNEYTKDELIEIVTNWVIKEDETSKIIFE